MLIDKIIVITIASFVIPAYGQIYEYIDSSGNKLYTDRQPFFLNSNATGNEATKNLSDSTKDQNKHQTNKANHLKIT